MTRYPALREAMSKAKRSYRKLHLRFTQADRDQVRMMLRRSHESARVLRRVAILSLLDKGESAKSVSRLLDVSPTTVRTIGRRYIEEGLAGAIYDRPHA